MISVQSVSKVYSARTNEVAALSDISISLDENEFVAIVGPSGSGKSTLLSILGALCRPTNGKVVVDSIDTYALSTERLADFRREYLGFVFQSFQLIPYLTVFENVLLPLAVTSFTRAEKGRMAIDIIERVGLRSMMLRLPDELSGGEQQRTAIARALVNQPPILLADEPTGNLDSANGSGIMNLLQDLHREGHTIVMVTHNQDNLNYVQRVIPLKDGRLDPEKVRQVQFALISQQ